MKRVLLLLVMLSALSPLFARSEEKEGFYLGFDVGANLTIPHTKTVWKSTNDWPFVGGEVSVDAEYRFLSWLALDFGVKYIVKSELYVHDYKGSGSTQNVFSYGKFHHFIEFPLTLRFYMEFDSRYSFFIGGGGFLGFRLFEHQMGMYTTVLNGKKFISSIVELNSGDNRFDAGLLAEAGLSIDLDVGYLNVALCYQYGLTSLSKGQPSAVNTYLDTLTLSAGILFSL